MTTAELVALIAAERAAHAGHGDVRHTDHWPAGCVVTIGSLASRAGLPRRVIEEAIQTARLEGTLIVTDGGVRVATTAEDAYALARWLMARMATQQATHAAVLAEAQLMERGEAAGAERLTLWEDAA